MIVDIKKFIRKKAKEWKQESAETKKYREELKKKIKTAQRKTFAEESVKRAIESTKRKVKQRYAPKTRAGYFDAPISPALNQLIFGTTPTPKQAVHKVLKRKKKRKKKRRN
ncbi:hypothetical protein LCGC14_2501600 [marine sediment metagenome]|uniref:Uncharacterized protein n=1 Tax=marine sediment metagenome TaxID=412755 RepID=A0A0F9B1Q2_9ZZZZ